ncbi:unnamed protein product [Caenorhabditis angaria]|uniref:COMM domain-containing protein n=1 Tax=Caenorhabditis angaria TaxID=860376 RepID=A0A9P1MZ28_9PELO|nr:unnamed protein product [Caenorhabditis angaria]
MQLENALKILKNVEKLSEDEVEKYVKMLVTKIEDKIENRELAEAIWSIFIFAAREPQKSTQIFPPNFDFLSRIFEKYQKNLLETLQTMNWEYPEIVDFSWQIAKSEKCSIFGGQPMAYAPLTTTVTLETLEAGHLESQKNAVKLSFDEMQLTDFLWKLKEAENFAQNILE